MKKRKQSTWVKQHQRQTQIWCVRIALCFQKWKPMIWVDRCSSLISKWTSVNFVSYNAGPLSTRFGCKIKLFHSVFLLSMISTNNKIRNENPALTGSLAGSKRVFSTFHLSSTRTNQRTCCIIDAAGSRPGFRQKSRKRDESRTCRKPGCKPGRKPGLQPGLQLARITECGF